MSIIVKDLQFVYSPNTPFVKKALIDVNLTINTGEWVAIVGHTGSGKSTFVQHLNGLIKLQSGSIIVDELNLGTGKPDLRALRRKVGMVFQYPEYQLFADTVYNDVAFGLRNSKVKEDDIKPIVKRAIELVGLNFEYIKDKSPFELSGGEKRRVAIAGVIVLEPQILVLDEPTAGLDPQGKKEILTLISQLKATVSPTIIMINHDMNEVSKYATQVIVFDEGTVKYDTTPVKLFNGQYNLNEIGLDLPQMAKLRLRLVEDGINIDEECLTIDKMFDCLTSLSGRAK